MAVLLFSFSCYRKHNPSWGMLTALHLLPWRCTEHRQNWALTVDILAVQIQNRPLVLFVSDTCGAAQSRKPLGEPDAVCQ